MLSRVLGRRRAGVLLHPTSLPGHAGHGRLGAQARQFVDFLSASGLSVWQTLPLAPPDEYGSPYSSESVFAGDIGLLDPDALSDDGLIGADEARELSADAAALTDLLPRLAQRLNESRHAALKQDAHRFMAREAYWLDDYALYRCLRTELHAPWMAWPDELRARDPDALQRAWRRLATHAAVQRVGQFLFDRQWRSLRAYAAQRDILLFGDMPFFVAHDSADVWAHRNLFRVDTGGALTVETGVPPDYFAADGQLWRMPHYDWEVMRASGYRWWVQRLSRQAELFDIMRIDHFRGLAAAWEVPAGATTAIDGHWAPGPGMDLLGRLQASVGQLALAAEDLGYITDDVRQLRHDADLPGMRVFQFGFDGDPANPHLPGNCAADEILYTGTHDNDTLCGWYTGLDEHTRQLVRAELSLDDAQPLCPAVKRRVLASTAQLVMLPMQDVLCLGAEARMNTPGRAGGNWSWRLDALPTAEVAASHRALLAQTQRLL